LPFANAVVLPHTISTAAEALYPPGTLELPLPTAKTDRPERVGKSIVIWGAASSVGSAAVQLAAASGVDVIGTASPRNHAYVKELGARDVVDYNSPEVANDVASAVTRVGSTFIGIFDAVASGGWEEVVRRLGGKVLTARPSLKGANFPSDMTISSSECMLSAIHLFNSTLNCENYDMYDIFRLKQPLTGTFSAIHYI
jgi:NADPH:quinone reductase-like Zn-dependent oxidoreductase